MEGFTGKLMDAIMTQGGIYATAATVALLWISRQWAVERKAHNTTRDKLFEMAEKQNGTNNTVSEALVGLKVVLETVLRGR